MIELMLCLIFENDGANWRPNMEMEGAKGGRISLVGWIRVIKEN